MTAPAGDQWNPTCVAEETCCKLLGKLIKGRCDLTIREGYTEHFSHMPVRERDGVCWEKRCSLLWHFTRGNLVGSLVTSAVSLEGSADTNAGSRGTKPSSSLCYGAPLPWQVYIEKTFSDFPLLFQLLDWTHGQRFAARNLPSRPWLQLGIEWCLWPLRSSSDGHQSVQISLMSPHHSRQQDFSYSDLFITCPRDFFFLLLSQMYDRILEPENCLVWDGPDRKSVV